MPSPRPITLPTPPSRTMSEAHATNASDDSSTSGISLVMVFFCTFIGITTAVSPTIIKMLKILLPTTLPIANCALPFIDDTRLTISSGADVPNATIVRPMTRSEMPKRLATDDEPSVNPFAPSKIKAIPPKRKTISKNNAISLCFYNKKATPKPSRRL